MFISYLKTAFRNLKRHAGYSFINIVSLSIGMACFIFIALIIRGEFQVDKFHERADRIYRVIRVDNNSGETTRVAVTQAPLASALKRDFPDVEKAACFNYIGDELVKYGNKKIKQEWISLAEPDFFEIFSYTFLAGSPESALKQPHSAVLTDEVAQKLFGEEDPIGKILRIRNMADVMVSAVIKDHKDSHLHFSIILPFSLYREIGVNIDNWGHYNYTTYIQLQENTDPAAFGAKIKGALSRYISPETKSTLELQPLKRIYLYSDYAYDVKTIHVNILAVYVLGIVAFLILFIACINFMNLATARSARRAREVGLRKVVGAKRGQLVSQFLGESLLFSFISLVFAVVIVELFLPLINSIQPIKAYALFESKDIILYLGLVLVALMTGLISGSYPALFLSRFQPAMVLKGFLGQTSGRGMLRKILVVSQFTFSIILIIATLTVFRQMRFMQNKDLGYDKSNLLVCSLPDNVRSSYESLKTELLRHRTISKVTACLNLPIWEGPSYMLSDWEGRESDKEIYMYHGSVDYDFFDTFGIDIVQGRKFSRDFATDKETALIVNEEAVRTLGMKDPISKKMGHFKGKGTIVGVMEDYHHATLRDRIGPLVLDLDPQDTAYMILKVSPEDLTGTTARIEKIWNGYDPNQTFEARLLEDILEDVYLTESSISRFFNYAAYLSLLISCLGLFGLAAFSVEQRIKEVGIRKVLGASVGDIISLLSKEHLKLIAIANIFAWPLGYFAMRMFMQNYPFRASLGIEIFLMSAAAGFGIAFLTVFYQTFKAARANPADTLKYE
ncbi:MAG: FtsX-like permease family protein [Candidatus Aminicenantes bacterium]|nr:MAG: FtsX-like permease family protein [Candidatus Aminicenantes bacterium]